jgi:succinate-semialdehyde dehydrogenase / glutarate-semialdehyde dehydrogenase
MSSIELGFGMTTDVQITARRIASVNPATGEVLREFECAGPEEIIVAVERARAIQAVWAGRSIGERIDVLRQFQRRLHEKKSEIAAAITREAG